VVPAGGGLVASSAGGPAQGEGEPGAGDEPGGVLLCQAGQPGGLGDRQLDRADLARAGLAAAGGHRRVAEGNHQVSVGNVVVVVAGVAVLTVSCALTCGDRGQGDDGVQGVADGDVAELGEGGQDGVPADPGEGPDLGLVPAEHVLARFERFHGPAAPGNGDEVRQGRGPGLRRAAQVEGVLVRAGDQAADQQELPRVRGRGQRPVREAGPLGPAREVGASGSCLPACVTGSRLARAEAESLPDAVPAARPRWPATAPTGSPRPAPDGKEFFCMAAPGFARKIYY
jgi:hypothetical protein